MKSLEGLSSSHLRDDGTGAASWSKENRKTASHAIVCVYRFEGKLGGREEQWEEGNVACDCQGAEGAEVSTVFER